MRHPIWAPRADSLELELDGKRTSLNRDERGRFFTETCIPPGARYAFWVNGRGPFPDPRSDYQPDGVHGPSMRWDQSAFVFKNQDFVPVPFKEAVVYELHVGTFSEEGTFLGAIPRLDHLAQLGVTHVELLPLCAFPGHQGWGYDGVSLFAPHAPYGTPDDLKKFVDEAHGRNIAVLLDLVLNHLGPDGNYLGLYAPYFTDRYKTPWGEAVNLDGADSDLARRFFIDAALHWLRTYRFDGLRLDAVHALYDKSAVHFLEQLGEEVKTLSRELGRPLPLIAECDLNDPRYVRSVEAGGLGLDAQWCDDFHHALHSFLTGERDGYYEDYGRLEQVAKGLRQGYVFDGNWSAHRRRPHGRPPVGVASEQLVVFAQNHDQVGNRAHGDRLASLVSHERLFQAAALTLLSPYVPLIFQGEEWGTKRPFLYFTDHQDEDLARAVTEGRRREFGYFAEHHGEVPDPQERDTFERSTLDWKEKSAGLHRQLLDWYRTLLRLRREYPAQAALSGSTLSDVRVTCDKNENWLVFARGDLRVFFNFSGDPQRVPGYERVGDVLACYPEDLEKNEQMPPNSVVIAL